MTMNNIRAALKRSLPLALTALLSACVSNVALRKDLAVPATPSKLAARVVLVETDPPAAYKISKFEHHRTFLALQPGASHAVRTMLSGLFTDFSVATPGNIPTDADLVATYSFTDSKEDFTLDLREPGAPPRFVMTRDLFRKKPSGFGPINLLQFIPPFYFFMPMSSSIFAADVRAKAEAGLKTGLTEMAAELSTQVPQYLAAKRIVLAAESQGDALAAQDPAGALAAYQPGLAASHPHGILGRRLRDKVTAVLIRLPAPDAPSAESRESMARGKALIERAASLEDFRSAVAAMEKSLNAEPAWSAGHFNTAVAHEGAGEWLAAVEHLKTYLTLKPLATDAEDIRQKIAELQIRHEKGDLPPGIHKPE